MKYIVLLALVITFASQKSELQTGTASEETPIITTTNEYKLEKFNDETKIGKRRLNRIEISTYIKEEGLFIKTKFYTKSKSKWVLKNEFDIEKIGELPINPHIKDFNGDGFNDLTFVSEIARPSENEIRALFIYDPHKDELVYIKNSGDYPNLQYNPLLKCIDAWIFSKSNSTVFLKLENDKLVAFARVSDNGTERTIYVIDQNGEEKLLRREQRKDDGIFRYINFNPVKAYEVKTKQIK